MISVIKRYGNNAYKIQHIQKSIIEGEGIIREKISVN